MKSTIFSQNWLGSSSVPRPPENYNQTHFSSLVIMCINLYVCSVYWKSQPKHLNVLENKLQFSGQAESSECWFCMMSCTLIGLTKYHIYFTCGLQGKKVWLLDSRTPTPRMVSWACHKWPLSGQPEALLTVTPKTKEKRLSPLLLSQNYPNLSSQLDFPHILNTHTRTHTHFIQGVSAAYLPLVQLKFCKLPTCPFIFELAFLQNLLQLLKSHTIPIWKGTLSEQQES